MATIAPADILRVRLDIEATGERRRDAAWPATLCIENNGEEPLIITHVKHLLPAGVSLVAASDSYLRRQQVYDDLTKELRLLIQDEYFFNDPQLQAARREQVTELIKEAIGAVSGSGLLSKVVQVLRIFLAPLLAAAVFQRWQDRFNANQLVIESYQDAQIAWEMVAGLPAASTQQDRNRNVIELKLRQLKELENERNSQASGPVQWSIDPHSSHSEALILRCDKSIFAVRRYPIVIEVTATSAQTALPVTKRTSSSAEVPPKDLPLAVLAMICAPIGLLARLVVQNPGISLGQLADRAGVPQLIMASALGFVVCITFERLRWGNSARLSLSWRTAVFLGFAVGVGTDNFLKAVQSFFGITLRGSE